MLSWGRYSSEHDPSPSELHHPLSWAGQRKVFDVPLAALPV